jgi:coenzyme F420-reducing hydrogenase delta subunit
MITELLEDFGFEKERYTISWLSSSEPDKLVKAFADMTERIKTMGPADRQDSTG